MKKLLLFVFIFFLSINSDAQMKLRIINSSSYTFYVEYFSTCNSDFNESEILSVYPVFYCESGIKIGPNSSRTFENPTYPDTFPISPLTSVFGANFTKWYRSIGTTYDNGPMTADAAYGWSVAGGYPGQRFFQQFYQMKSYVKVPNNTGAWPNFSGSFAPLNQGANSYSDGVNFEVVYYEDVSPSGAKEYTIHVVNL